MAKSGKKRKGKSGKPGSSGSDRRDLDMDMVQERHKLTVMMAAALVVASLAWVFALHHLLPTRAARQAEAAVEDYEAGRDNVLERFRQKAAQQGIEILGYETEVFPRVTLVTYVYRMPGSNDRKAFWWAYEANSGEVERVSSVTHFVDEFLLPSVDQLHQDVTGVPGPLARERHQEKT